MNYSNDYNKDLSINYHICEECAQEVDNRVCQTEGSQTQKSKKQTDNGVTQYSKNLSLLKQWAQISINLDEPIHNIPLCAKE